jgi:hypothetical protein
MHNYVPARARVCMEYLPAFVPSSPPLRMEYPAPFGPSSPSLCMEYPAPFSPASPPLPQKLLSKMERRAKRTRASKVGAAGGGDADVDWLGAYGLGAVIEEEMERESAANKLVLGERGLAWAGREGLS